MLCEFSRLETWREKMGSWCLKRCHLIANDSQLWWALKSHSGDRSVHLLRFLQMDQLLPGMMYALAVTVLQFEISSEVCSRFRHDEDISGPGKKSIYIYVHTLHRLRANSRRYRDTDVVTALFAVATSVKLYLRKLARSRCYVNFPG